MTEPVLQSKRLLYVGGLADEVKESNLRAVMLPFGPIKSIDIPMDYSAGKVILTCHRILMFLFRATNLYL
jgi:peptidyl-prolyl isomerase E (cyclophilin E)